MATQRTHPTPTTQLRVDLLEPRETPAVTPVIDFAGGFTADRIPGGIPAGYVVGDLLLTDGLHQARSVFAPTRVDVRAFETSFAFRIGDLAGPKGDGFTFALTGDDGNAAGTAGGGAGEGLGYEGLTDSVAIKFDLVDNAGEGSNSVGIITGGSAPKGPAVSLDATGIDLHSGRSYRADIAYDGQTLTLSLTDAFDPDVSWTHEFAVDIPAAVGADTGFAGFTAGTGALYARQAIHSWTYAEVTADPPTNQTPVVTAAARASWLSPSSAALTIEATDDGGPGNLTYTWEVVSAPDGAAPQFSPLSGGSVAVTLDRAGRHTFRVTVRDAEGLAATSEVSYTDPLRVNNFEVSAAAATVRGGETIQFQTLVRDAAGIPTPEPLAPTWRVISGPGVIDPFGRYTAPVDASGPVTVQAEIPVMLRTSLLSRTAEATVNVVGAFEGVNLTQNGSAQVAGGHLRLADGQHQAGSAFAAAAVDVTGFSTSFWFQIGDQPNDRAGDGLTFVLQNAGPTALGKSGGGLGYEGIESSVAVKFDLVDNAGEGANSVGVFIGGVAPTTPADLLPGHGYGGIPLNLGHVLRVDMTYADGLLRLELWDTVTGHGYGRSYAVDIPAAVGGPKAFAGFTAGTGELFAPIEVLKWTYTSEA